MTEERLIKEPTEFEEPSKIGLDHGIRQRIFIPSKGGLVNRYIIWMSQPRFFQDPCARIAAEELRNRLMENGWVGNYAVPGSVNDLSEMIDNLVDCGKLLIYIDDTIQLIDNDFMKPTVQVDGKEYPLSKIGERLDPQNPKKIEFGNLNLFLLGPMSGLGINDTIQLIENDHDHPCLHVTSMGPFQNLAIDEFNLAYSLDPTLNFLNAAITERERLGGMQEVQIKYMGSPV